MCCMRAQCAGPQSALALLGHPLPVISPCATPQHQALLVAQAGCRVPNPGFKSMPPITTTCHDVCLCMYLCTACACVCSTVPLYICVQSPYGGAINGQEQEGSLTIRNCRFFNNTATDKGSAIHVENRRFALRVFDSVFDQNQVGKSGFLSVAVHHSCLLSLEAAAVPC